MTSNTDDRPPLPDERNIRRRQIAVVFAACVAVGSLVIYAYYKSLPPDDLYQPAHKEVVTRKIENPAPVDEREIWRAHSQKELLRLTQDNKQLQGDVERLKLTVDALAEKTNPHHTNASQPKATIPMTPLPPPPVSRSINNSLLPPPPGPITPGQSTVDGRPVRSGTATRSPSPDLGKQASSGRSGFYVIDIAETAGQVTGDGANTKKTVDNYLPPGTYIKTRLLSGLDAPTGGQAQKDPVPFLLRLVDDGQLPNGFRSHIKHCFVVLAGYGNISDNRVYGRAEKISCVLHDKTVFDANIKAYVSGEDGKAGLQAKLRNKRGQLIAYSLLSGLGGGLGEAIAQSYTTISTNPIGSTSTVDPGEIGAFGLAQGLGTALDRVSRWYLDRADEIYPVLEVNAGRTPELVLLDGLDFSRYANLERSQRPLVTPANKTKRSVLEVRQ